MNCQEVRQKISGALAAEVPQLPEDLAGHERSCPACHDFYQAQSQLFRSLDAGLQVIANRPVPPSLLPAIRMRIESMLPKRGVRRLVLWPAAGVTAIACALLFFSFLRRPQTPRDTHVASAPIGGLKQDVASTEQTPQTRVVASREPVRRSTRRTRSTPEPVVQTGATVVIDRSESRGLVLLARVAFQEPETAQKLAPQQDSSPLVIQPVAIPGLEIRPLGEDNR